MERRTKKLDRRTRAGGEEELRRSDDLAVAIARLPQTRIDEILSRIQTRKLPST